jgi:hypothetical protein
MSYVYRTSNDASCLLLEEKLRSYSALVDERSEDAVNNYAKSSLALAAHCKNGKEDTLYSILVILHVFVFGDISVWTEKVGSRYKLCRRLAVFCCYISTCSLSSFLSA